MTFGLNPKARFHDGTPITPEDVIFSLEALKKAHPRNAFYYKNVIKAEKTGEHEVTFTFDVKGNRELPQIVGQLSVLPKQFWEGKGANGEPRDVTKTTMEIPLGSGAYRIKSFDAGPHDRLRARQGLLGEGPARLPRASGTSTRSSSRISSTARRRSRSSRPASSTFGVRTQPAVGRRQYDFDAVKKGLGEEGGASRVKRVAPMQAFVFN